MRFRAFEAAGLRGDGRDRDVPQSKAGVLLYAGEPITEPHCWAHIVTLGSVFISVGPFDNGIRGGGVAGIVLSGDYAGAAAAGGKRGYVTGGGRDAFLSDVLAGSGMGALLGYAAFRVRCLNGASHMSWAVQGGRWRKGRGLL